MKMKYCPECGSIQIQSVETGLKCKKCSYIGDMKEDSIDVINSFIACKKNGNSNATEVQSGTATNLIMQQKSAQNSLKERLKKFQNEDIEIL